MQKFLLSVLAGIIFSSPLHGMNFSKKANLFQKVMAKGSVATLFTWAGCKTYKKYQEAQEIFKEAEKEQKDFEHILDPILRRDPSFSNFPLDKLIPLIKENLYLDDKTDAFVRDQLIQLGYPKEFVQKLRLKPASCPLKKELGIEIISNFSATLNNTMELDIDKEQVEKIISAYKGEPIEVSGEQKLLAFAKKKYPDSVECGHEFAMNKAVLNFIEEDTLPYLKFVLSHESSHILNNDVEKSINFSWKKYLPLAILLESWDQLRARMTKKIIPKKFAYPKTTAVNQIIHGLSAPYMLIYKMLFINFSSAFYSKYREYKADRNAIEKILMSGDKKPLMAAYKIFNDLGQQEKKEVKHEIESFKKRYPSIPESVYNNKFCFRAYLEILSQDHIPSAIRAEKLLNAIKKTKNN